MPQIRQRNCFVKKGLVGKHKIIHSVQASVGIYLGTFWQLRTIGNYIITSLLQNVGIAENASVNV